MPDVSPELAGKVLDADIANVIKKVGAGKPLTVTERDLMQRFAQTQDDLHKARQAALIRKWVDGGRLNGAEIAEIVDILPESVIQSHQRAAPAPNALAKPDYQRGQQEYAVIYGAAVRTIKKWVSIGRDARPADWPPLDAPAEMVKWWGRHMTQRVPEKLLAAASAANREAAASASAAPPSPPAASPGPLFERPSPAEVEERGELGFSGSLERVRVAERKAHAAYLAALGESPPDPATIKLLQKTWTDLVDQLRTLEKASPDVLKSSGEMVAKSEVAAALADIHATIRQSIQNLFRRAWPKMRGKDDAAAEEVWEGEIERVFSILRDHEFTVPA